MISTPQEIEQTAMAIANWIAYRGPFILPADNGKKVVLCLMDEAQYNALANPQDIEDLTAEPE